MLNDNVVYLKKNQIEILELKSIIESTLKRYKRKYEKTGVVRELRARQQFTKPSVIKRAQLMKAIYVKHLQTSEE